MTHTLCLFGAGRIASIHADNIAQNGRLRLAYVVDPDPVAAERLAARYDAVASDAATALADPSVDGVVVASPTDTHLQITLQAVEAGKAVFCEKPVDLDLSRARAAEAQVASGGRPVLVGFNRRFDPNFSALRRALDDAAAGTLESLHIISRDPAPPPPGYIAGSGGLFYDMAIHDFDMARWLLDEPVVEVFAHGAALFDQGIAAAGDVDTATAILQMASGRSCVVSNSRRSGFGYDQRIEAFCSDGLLRAANVHEHSLERWSTQGIATAPFTNFFLDRYAAAFRIEMDHFADVLDGAAPLVNYADGVAAVALAEAATRSRRLRLPVRVD